MWKQAFRLYGLYTFARQGTQTCVDFCCFFVLFGCMVVGLLSGSIFRRFWIHFGLHLGGKIAQKWVPDRRQKTNIFRTWPEQAPTNRTGNKNTKSTSLLPSHPALGGDYRGVNLINLINPSDQKDITVDLTRSGPEARRICINYILNFILFFSY